MLAYGKLSRDLMAHGKNGQGGGDYIGLEFSGKVQIQCFGFTFRVSNLHLGFRVTAETLTAGSCMGTVCRNLLK